MRYENWKFVFAEQRCPGTLAIWTEPFTHLRGGKMFDLRADPYERADITSNTYYDWVVDHLFLVVPSQSYVTKFIETFKEFPPRQKPASFGIDQALETLQNSWQDVAVKVVRPIEAIDSLRRPSLSGSRRPE